MDGDDFMSCRVAQYAEPPAAAVTVDPALGVQSLEIVAVEQVIGPLLVAGLPGFGGAVNIHLAAAAELGLIAYTTKWTFNSKHYQSHIVIN
jgi:hypothetical protein